jgi:hypothetical protein
MMLAMASHWTLIIVIVALVLGGYVYYKLGSN